MENEHIEYHNRYGAKKIVLAVLKLIFKTIRIILYIIMLWLRWPIVGLCGFISSITLLCFLFSWYAFPEYKTMVHAMGWTSFISFVILVAYDYILAIVSPYDIAIIQE